MRSTEEQERCQGERVRKARLRWGAQRGGAGDRLSQLVELSPAEAQALSALTGRAQARPSLSQRLIRVGGQPRLGPFLGQLLLPLLN